MSQKFPKIWNQISTQLHTSFGGAVVLIVAISILTIFVLDHIRAIQYNISEKSMPEMQSAFAVAQQTATLVAAAPQLATAATMEQFEDVVSSVSTQEKAFEIGLSTMLQGQGDNELTLRIKADGMDIIRDIAQIKILVRERFDLRQRTAILKEEMRSVHDKLMAVLTTAIDNQMFYTITGHWSLDSDRPPRSVHFSEPELQAYRHLVELREAATATTQLLATAFTINDSALLQPLREKFDARAGLANRSLNALSYHPAHKELSRSFLDLLSIGRRESNGFELHGRELAIAGELSTLLHDSQTLGVDIVAMVESIVGEYSMAALDMAEKATDITRTSSTLLLIINLVSITGAILIGWLFVERRLIRRLNTVSQQIQRIAAGNLEVPI